MSDGRTCYLPEDYCRQQVFLPRPPSPSTLAGLGITPAQIAAAVASVLVPYGRVVTYGNSYVEPCPPSISAYGMDRGVTLCAECNASGNVSELWLFPWRIAPDDVDRVADVLSKLPKTDVLLFVDLAGRRSFEASDRAAWLAYFEEHLSDRT